MFEDLSGSEPLLHEPPDLGGVVAGLDPFSSSLPAGVPAEFVSLFVV